MPPDDDELVVPVVPPPPPVVPARSAAPPTRQPIAGDEDTRDRDHDTAISNVRERERKRYLKDQFGTDDPDEIEKIKKARAEDAARVERERQELETLRKEREERNRASMSEVERLTTDLKTANDKISKLQEELTAAKQEALSERQNASVKQAAIRHRLKAKPAVLRVVLQDFATHFLALSGLEKRKFNNQVEAERALDRWMKRYASENPEMCDLPPKELKEEETTTTTTTAPRVATPPVRRPLGAPAQKPGAPPARRVPTGAPTPGMDENGKTVKPGLPNSMNATELAAYRRKQGLKSA